MTSLVKSKRCMRTALLPTCHSNLTRIGWGKICCGRPWLLSSPGPTEQTCNLYTEEAHLQNRSTRFQKQNFGPDNRRARLQANPPLCFELWTHPAPVLPCLNRGKMRQFRGTTHRRQSRCATLASSDRSTQAQQNQKRGLGIRTELG